MPGRTTWHSEEWWANAPTHILRCTAHYKSTGEQCRRVAALGTNVCNAHGALAPHVQAAAARRIQMSVEDAAKALRELAFDEKGDPRVRLKAIQDLLDRGGLGVTSKHLVGVVTDDPVEKLFQSLLRQPDALVSAAPPPPALPVRDTVQEAYEAVQEASPYDVSTVRETGVSGVVRGEVVERAKTPPHIRQAMRELL